MWSGPNLTAFIRVTSHWIEAQTKDTPSGPQQILKLCADLVGFCPVPGQHTGEHLTHAFLHVLDHLDITEKVIFLFCVFMCYNFLIQIGWVTLDNASNNDKMMIVLECEL